MINLRKKKNTIFSDKTNDHVLKYKVLTIDNTLHVSKCRVLCPGLMMCHLDLISILTGDGLKMLL